MPTGGVIVVEDLDVAALQGRVAAIVEVTTSKKHAARSGSDTPLGAAAWRGLIIALRPYLVGGALFFSVIVGSRRDASVGIAAWNRLIVALRYAFVEITRRGRGTWRIVGFSLQGTKRELFVRPLQIFCGSWLQEMAGGSFWEVDGLSGGLDFKDLRCGCNFWTVLSAEDRSLDFFHGRIAVGKSWSLLSCLNLSFQLWLEGC